jgi:hypothetical protein
MESSPVTFAPAAPALAGAGSPQRLLILTDAPARFAPFASEADFVLNERQAICTLAARQNEYRAVIAGVAEADGRECGYRFVRLLRTQLLMRCPIYLFSQAPTPSSRAYALQCGATKLLTDDQDLVDDLVMLVGAAPAREEIA